MSDDFGTDAVKDEFDKGWDFYTRREYKSARKCWRPLAEQGYAEAQVQLGIMYERALGVDKNLSVAVGWYRKAARQGHGLAQAYMGSAYENGNGVGQDDQIACFWYSIALAGLPEGLTNSRDKMRERLSDKKLGGVQYLIEQCNLTNFKDCP